MATFRGTRWARAGRVVLMLALGVGVAACAGKGEKAGVEPAPAAATRAGVLGEDAGLEVLVLSVRAGDREFAARMTGLNAGMSPLPSAQEKLWGEHGLRIVSVPAEQLPAALSALGGAGAPGAGAQKQWLGQSPAWIELARGPLRREERVVALDVERISLPAGALRLLARSWLEPVPPAEGGDGTPGAVLRIDLVPQNMEDRSAAASNDPLGITQPSIAPEDQGLLFARLLAKLSVRGDQAFVVVPERPGVDWARAAAEPEAEGAQAPVAAEDRPAPKVGQVVRSGSRAGGGGGEPEPRGVNREESAGGEWGGHGKRKAEPAPEPAERPAPAPRQAREPRVAGPSAPRVPTVGEAMLGGEGVRTVVVLVPRVPREFSLTPGR